MREPVRHNEIRKGDRILVEIRAGGVKEFEYVASRDGEDGGIGGSAVQHFLLDRPAPAVGLPTEPTLGWVTSKFGGTALGTWERYEGSVGSLAGEVSALVRERDVPIYDVTAFVEAVAVPKAALDKLRGDRGGAVFEVDLDVAIDTFLAAVDAANGADQ